MMPDSLLNKDILVVGRIVSTEGIEGGALRESCYPGNKVIENIISIQKKSNHQVSIKLINYPSNIHSRRVRTMSWETSKTMEDDTMKASIDKKKVKIDITRLLFSDNNLIWLSKWRQSDLLGLDSISTKTTVNYIQNNISSLDIGIEKKYQTGKTLFINISFVTLSSKPMLFRVASPYVNFFNQEIKVDSSRIKAILRWNIEPKIYNQSRFVKQAANVPRKQIVYYLDENIPSKWLPYFRNGVLDWNSVFEKIGFKDVLVVKEIPAQFRNNQGFKLQIAHSIIHYLRTPNEDATYSIVTDPRSGEILQSHIFWSSALEERMKRTYFSQAAASDIRARKSNFDDSLMGTMIQRIITHEIGHALGFDHNMFASSFVPVENYRNDMWLSMHGLSASIMDYAKYNYIAQPDDSIVSEKSRFWSIGEYDEWALRWGYSYWSNLDNSKINRHLNEILEERKRFSFLYFQVDNSDDPRAVVESLSDNHIVASKYGLKNLEFIRNNLALWSKHYGYDSVEVKTRYDAVDDQYCMYLYHVIVLAP